MGKPMALVNMGWPIKLATAPYSNDFTLSQNSPDCVLGELPGRRSNALADTTGSISVTQSSPVCTSIGALRANQSDTPAPLQSATQISPSYSSPSISMASDKQSGGQKRFELKIKLGDKDRAFDGVIDYFKSQ